MSKTIFMEAVLPDATILAAGLVMFRLGTRSAGKSMC
jgi:hypothetical protein